MSDEARHPGGLRLFFVLGGIALAGPAAMDIYLPGFPALARDLGASPSQAQITLTAFLVGLAIGQIVGGSVSDAYGRRRPMLVSVAGFTLSTFCCALPADILTLSGVRVIQGATASAGVVIARAVVRDVYSGNAVASFLSRLWLIVGLGPLVAPILGAQVLKVTSWRGIFVVLGLFGIALFAATVLLLPETLAHEHRLRGGMSGTWRTTRTLLTERSLVGLILVSAFAGGAMVGYVGGSPFVLQEIYGASPQQYAAIFGINAIFMVGGAQLNAHLLGRRSARELLGVGVLALVCAGALLLAAAGFGQESLLIITPPLSLLAFSWSFIQANALGLALHDHPFEAGVTASLFGVSMYGLGALIAPLVTSGADEMALSMAAVIALCAFGAGLSLRKYVPMTPPMTRLESGRLN